MPENTLTLPFMGFDYVDYYNGEYENNTLTGTLGADNPNGPVTSDVAQTGATSVALNPDWGLDVAEGSVYAGAATTDTTADLEAAIEQAESAGISVFVRPTIDFLYNQVSVNGPLYGNPGDYYVPPGPYNGQNLPTGEPDANGGSIPDTANGIIPTNKFGDPTVGEWAARAFLNPLDLDSGHQNLAGNNAQPNAEEPNMTNAQVNNGGLAVFFGSPTTPGSYDYMIAQEAAATEQAIGPNGKALFAIGVELDTLAADPAAQPYWTQLIDYLRNNDPNLSLTYSSTWSQLGNIPSSFWNQLDYVGIDGYVPLYSASLPGANATNETPGSDETGDANDSNPTLQQLIDGWTTPNSQVLVDGQYPVGDFTNGLSVIDYFDTVAQESISGKFIFDEIGYPNDTSAAEDPTGGSTNEASPGNPANSSEPQTYADPALQAELYQAFFDAWGQAQQTAEAGGGDVDGIPFALDGFYFWDWTPDGQNDGWNVYDNPSALTNIEQGMVAPTPVASPITVVPETNFAGVAGYMGSPRLASGSVLAGDSDSVAGATLSVTAVQNGTIGKAFATQYGELTLNADGSYLYAPNATALAASTETGAPVQDTITFTVSDTDDNSTTSTLTIADYRDPTAQNETNSVVAGQTVTGSAIAGDSDPDGVALTPAAINTLGELETSPIQGQYGTLTLNSDGSYSYTADSAAALASAFAASKGQPLTDGFQLVIGGGAGTFAPADLDITITEAPPVATGPVLSLLYKGFDYIDSQNGEYSAQNLQSLSSVANTGADSVGLTPEFGIDVAESSIYAGGATTDTVTDLQAAISTAGQNRMTSFVQPLVDFLYNQVSPNGPVPYGSAGDYYVPPTQQPFNPANLPTGEPDANGGSIPATQNGTVPANAGTWNYAGFLNPADMNAQAFFGSATTAGSYDYMIVNEAVAAAASGATLFSIGNGLDSLANNTAYTGDWDQLIQDVRAAAPTLKLTYSANWINANQVTFWNELDYVGIDGYLPLSNDDPDAANDDNPSLASLIAAWTQPSSVTLAGSSETVSQALNGMSAVDFFDQLAQQSISKQFIFTELGYQNDTSAALDPTGGSNSGEPDPSLQAELYQAFFDAWGAAQGEAATDGGLFDGVPFSLVGAYLYDWTPDGTNDDWTVGANAQAAQAVTAGFAQSVLQAFSQVNTAAEAGALGEVTPATGTGGPTGSGALNGDTDANNAAFSITSVAGGTVGTPFNTEYGQLLLNSDGSYSYIPNTAALNAAPHGAPPTDTIEFTVTDTDGVSSESTLTITDWRDPIVTGAGTSVTEGQTIQSAIGAALAGDTDPDDATMYIQVLNSQGQVETGPVQGQYGTLTLQSDGTFSYTADSVDTLAPDFLASRDFPLTDTFNVLVSGPDGTSATSTLSISVASLIPPWRLYDPLMINNAGLLYFDQLIGNTMNYVQIGALGPEWEFDGTANNLLGDGNPGFLIRNTGSVEGGALYLGEVVDGTAQYTLIGGIGAEWQFVGDDDFLGDGQSQFLIRNTGSVEPGTLDLGQIVNGQMQFTTIGGLGLEWQFEGSGDFLNDGRQQFLFRNTGSIDPGALFVGEVDSGTAQFTQVSGVGTEWNFEGVGDFFGDGNTDFLLWNNGTVEPGAMAIGEMVNGQMTFTNIGGVGQEWQFVSTGNYIDTNKDDFLLRNTGNGELVVASVSGSVGNATVNFTVVGGVGQEWNFHVGNPALLA